MLSGIRNGHIRKEYSRNRLRKGLINMPGKRITKRVYRQLKREIYRIRLEREIYLRRSGNEISNRNSNANIDDSNGKNDKHQSQKTHNN